MTSLAVYDVSVPLRPEMPTYAGEPGPKLAFHSLMSRGDIANVSAISMGSHTGTHVDAPNHFLDDDRTVETLPVDAMVGPANVLAHDGESHITARDMESAGLPVGATRVLFKTGSGRFWEEREFRKDFVGLENSAARWLVDRGVALVGIDYLSIERFGAPNHEVHKTLLEAGVVIVEGLDLRQIEPGPYFMVCAPLNVVGADGAPARVYLLDDAP
jgi:arylformamidase